MAALAGLLPPPMHVGMVDVNKPDETCRKGPRAQPKTTFNFMCWPNIDLCPPSAQRLARPLCGIIQISKFHSPLEQRVPAGFEGQSQGWRWSEAGCHEGHITAKSLKYIKCQVVGRGRKRRCIQSGLLLIVSVVSWASSTPVPRPSGHTQMCVGRVCNGLLLDLWLSLQRSMV